MILARFEFEVPVTVLPQQLIGTSNSPHYGAAARQELIHGMYGVSTGPHIRLDETRNLPNRHDEGQRPQEARMWRNRD